MTAEHERGGDAAGSSLQSINQAINGTINDLPFQILDLGKGSVKGVNFDIALSPERLLAFTA